MDINKYRYGDGYDSGERYVYTMNMSIGRVFSLKLIHSFILF